MGNEGDDRITGGRGADVLDGGAGNDLLGFGGLEFWGEGNHYRGGAGDDALVEQLAAISMNLIWGMAATSSGIFFTKMTTTPIHLAITLTSIMVGRCSSRRQGLRTISR